jgi:hypothetical protein
MRAARDDTSSSTSDPAIGTLRGLCTAGGVAALLLIVYSVGTMVQLVSAVMLRTRVFSRTTGALGVLTHGLDLLHVALGPFATRAAAALMMIAGPLYLIWFPLVGRRLLRLGRSGQRRRR